MWESMNTGGKIGIVAGIIGGLIGVVAALFGVLSGPGGFGSKIGGLIFLIVFVSIFFGVFFFVFRKVFGPMNRQHKLQKTGSPAEATILEVAETGMTVNRIYPVVKLKLEVRPPAGQPYQAELQTIINRLDIPQFQPGAVLAVRYDPADPSKVALADASEPAAIDVSPTPSAAGFSPAAPGGLAPGAATAAASTSESERGRQMEEFLEQADAENEEIRKTGQPAPAVVVQAMPMNAFVNGENPAMTFILEVKPEGQPSFQAQTTGVIGEASVPKYQPGNTVYVKYDPDDHSRVSLDHS